MMTSSQTMKTLSFPLGEGNPRGRLERLLQDKIDSSKRLRSLQASLSERVNAMVGLSEIGPSIKEDLSRDTNLAFTVGAVATFIMEAFHPVLVSEKVINTFVQNLDGIDFVKVPYATRVTAGEINDAGEIAKPTTVDYSSEDIQLSIYGAHNGATFELRHHSNVELVIYELHKLGNALAVLCDQTVISAFATATPVDNSKSNYVKLGAGNFVEITDLFDYIKTMSESATFANPRVILTTPSIFKRLLFDSGEPTLMLGSHGVHERSWMSTMVNGVTVIGSPFMTSKTCYIVDPDNSGYLFHEPISNFTYRESGYLVEDTWAYMRMGCKVVQEEAIYRVVEDTA